MKYLVVLLVVLAVVWLIGAPARRLRRRQEEAQARPTPPPLPESIVACPACGLHLPRSEAVAGSGGFYCSEAHRSSHELAQPPG